MKYYYMKNMYSLGLAIFLLFSISGCSFKNYARSQPNIITIKTPTMKFSDIAYFHQDKDSVKIELYEAGIAVKTIEINRFVCSNEGCISKNAFNEDYLSGSYPDDLLKHILRKEPIYDAKNLIKTNDGFTQKIVTNRLNISYMVKKDSMRFKDSINNILIKFKKMKP